MQKSNNRDAHRAADVKDAAEVLGVSTSTIQKSLTGKRNNPKIVEPALEIMMELSEGKQALVERLKMQYNPNYSSITLSNSCN